MTRTLLTRHSGIDESRKILAGPTFEVSPDHGHNDDPLARFENEGGRTDVDQVPTARARSNWGEPG